jgi:hypothetical protein
MPTSSPWGHLDITERKGSLPSNREAFFSVEPSSNLYQKSGGLMASVITEDKPVAAGTTALQHSHCVSVPALVPASSKRSSGSMLSTQSLDMNPRQSSLMSGSIFDFQKNPGSLVTKESKTYKRLHDACMHARHLSQDLFAQTSYDRIVAPITPVSMQRHSAQMGTRPFTCAQGPENVR